MSREDEKKNSICYDFALRIERHGKVFFFGVIFNTHTYTAALACIRIRVDTCVLQR